MNLPLKPTPAELAAKEAMDRVYSCLIDGKSFVLEAGAGAGKTYSLIQALKYLIRAKGIELQRKGQKIACITYTNVARDEIESRTDRHPVILSSTIHGFCWSLIKDFQPRIREILLQLEKWTDRLKDCGDIKNYTINYDLGISLVKNNHISISHNDVLVIMVHLMEDSKFRKILSSRFPVIFIDEYQDTDKDFIESIKKHFIEKYEGPLLGFFGDHWQKIYGSGCGKIEHSNLISIGKGANFRSNRNIVDCLNRMRPDLYQEVNEVSSQGSVCIYLTNDWKGKRLTGAHWKDDLPSEVAHQCLEKVKVDLISQGWDFSPDKTKVLMLTHNLLAQEQGYTNITKVFDRNESYIKKEDSYIKFFIDYLEPLSYSYENKKYGEMFSIIDNKPIIRTHKDKEEWANHMNILLSLRAGGTIGKVIEHIRNSKYSLLPDEIILMEDKLETLENLDSLMEEEKKKYTQILRLRDIPYQEVVELANFVNDKTPFATKHGVKGSEFENVLVVLGRGWSLYNFSQMLEYSNTGVPEGKIDSFERNRNLFYVACSRPKKRLALLFTQKLTEEAISTLSTWFGCDLIKVVPG